MSPEFGKDARNTAVLVGALYDLKSARVAFRDHLARCMKSMRYECCRTDPDFWLKSKMRPEDGVQSYSYLLSYVVTSFVSIMMQMLYYSGYISPSHLRWDLATQTCI